MLRGYRGVAVVIVGGLVLLLLIVALGGQYLNREIERERATQYYQPARDEVAPVRRAAGQKKIEYYQPACQRPANREDSDLCAQWSSVEAAAESNGLARINLWLAFATFILSVSGTGLLIWTLRETRQTAMREQRAYIRVEPVPPGTISPGEPIILPMALINYGATPALHLALQSAVVVRDPLWDWSDENLTYSIPEGDRPNLTIHPDCPYIFEVTLDDPLPPKVYDAIMDGKAAVYARGRILYRDVFASERMTTFQLEFHGADKGDGTNGKLRISAKGNDFT